jgi:hypothetical protein
MGLSKRFSLGLFFLPLLALALPVGNPIIYTDASTALTRAAPVDGSKEGFDQASMVGWVYRICCPSGQTIISGNVRAYWQDPSDGKWSRTPTLDFTNINSGSISCWTSPNMKVSVPYGRGLEAADSIVCSGTSPSIESKTTGFTQ